MQPSIDSEAGVPLITREELVREMMAGSVQVVNVLEQPPTGALRLIPGSRHIPLSVIEQRMSELDRDRPVVAYCANVKCPASHQAAVRLAQHGFRVSVFPGGIEEWVTSGAPTERARE